jgi:hypothetical protein
MESYFNEVMLGDVLVSFVKLEPWRRLIFIADLQKDFVVPLLKSMSDKNGVEELFASFDNGKVDLLEVISSISNSIDGHIIDKWMRRILSEGMITYLRNDGQVAKMSINEVNELCESPADIINLIKRAVLLNIEGIGGLIGNFSNKSGRVVSV